MNRVNGRSVSRRNQGFTLLEMLFATVILPLLFLSAYAVLDSAYVISRTNGAFAQLNQSAMQTLRYISNEIEQTSPNLSPSHLSLTTDASNNTIATFQIPVDCDNDGDVVDDEGTSCVEDANTDKDVEWGAYDEAGQTQNGRLNAWARYSVVNGQLIREVLNNNLNPIQGLRRIVSNNVQSFRVSQNLNKVTMTMVLNGTDAVGQQGMARNFQANFTSSTILRNAVN